ncbi:hypothetical protein LMJF_12_0480 [Leishmania major strain Friedlin]|uniref:Uncharacterized protein n=1 Tax=Leishmania major TaxID=5664 RepID=Q4QGP4_LEIMA|nr:hypothetical protein LMJF_12_0480 [Leishmania major strain Friedlin]CAG9570455.1 hypothetical_protein_-_conserved [Leishmania major strain Friedlin]CAJ02612.1 hypothetical protein LMJF_12_0480 [Leishmania major strain Friedlin]|eukprot:XP_001681654.1 hypothetical protein LMJF_12_0480 [Leishmania major strain Friedlin]
MPRSIRVRHGDPDVAEGALTIEVPSSPDADNKAVGDARTPVASLGASSAFFTTYSTVSGDVAHPCANIASGAAPSDEVSPLTSALFMSVDSTPLASSCATKTAASLVNVRSFNSSATVVSVELPNLQSEHAAMTATSCFATRSRDTEAPAAAAAASATNPPPLRHPLGSAPIEGGGGQTQLAGEADTPVQDRTAAPSSSPLMAKASVSASFSGDSSKRCSHTVQSGLSDDLQLTQTTCYLPLLGSAGSREVQRSGDDIDARWVAERESVPAAEPARTTVGNDSFPAEGSEGAMVATTQSASTDVRAAACTVPASNISNTVAATATDVAAPLCPKFEVLATVPAPLVGRVPIRIHWCCAAHWRAVQRTERGAQWAVDGAPADVYCVPAHRNAKRERRSLSASCVEAKSESERGGRSFSGTGENTAWLRDAAGEVKPQHWEVRALSSAVGAPGSTLYDDSNYDAEHEKHGSLKTRSGLPHVHSHSCTDMLTCEFCGHAVERYHSEDCDDEASEASTSMTQTGRACSAPPGRFQDCHGCASAEARSLSSSKIVAFRSNQPSILTPQLLLSSSESAETTVDLDMSGAISSVDVPSWSDSAREEALMAAVALLQ